MSVSNVISILWGGQASIKLVLGASSLKMPILFPNTFLVGFFLLLLEQFF